jgi:hypothetical protein
MLLHAAVYLVILATLLAPVAFHLLLVSFFLSLKKSYVSWHASSHGLHLNGEIYHLGTVKDIT